MFKKGFTLVELMVVVSILSIIMLVLSQPLATVIKYQRESQITDNMRDNLQFVINKMEKELKTSSGVSLDTTTGVLSFTDQSGALVQYSRDVSSNEIRRNTSEKLTDVSVFKVTGLNFSINTATNLVTTSISAQSLDNKDSVTMQFSVLPLND